MSDWRIYYTDGSTFDSDAGTPEDRIPVGVAIIMQLDENGDGEDVKADNYYYWAGDEKKWQGSDSDGVIDRLLERKPVAALCQGRRMSRVDWQQLMTTAFHDPEFALE